MQRYWSKIRPDLAKLRPYVAGRGISEIGAKYGIPPERIVKLGSNENPYGPSPAVREALAKVAPELYPEPEELMDAISGYIGYPVEQIVIGTGMDGVIDTLARLFLDPGDLSAIATPTFSYYEIVTRTCGARPRFICREEDSSIPIEEMVSAGEDAKIIFICAPNNPTGDGLKEEDLISILEGADGIVFLDEAYVEFADRSLVHLVQSYENLVVGRTFSKAFALAGIRLGYAVMPEWLAMEYRRIAPPFFGVSVAAVAAGKAALGDMGYMERSVALIRSERERLFSEIEEAHPSQGNFLYIETRKPAPDIAREMLERGIIVRDCYSFRDAGDHRIRVTVGTPEQNDRFLEAYREICS